MGDIVQYKPGDVVNGHVLTEADGWVPVTLPVVPVVVLKRQRKRVMLWVLLGIQVVFVATTIAWMTSASNAANCASQTTQDLQDACTTGTGLGIVTIFLIMGALWWGLHLFLALVYGLYRLAAKRQED